MTEDQSQNRVYELARKLGSTAESPKIWGDRVVLYFPHRKEFESERIRELVSYCLERGYDIPGLDELDYAKNRPQFDCRIRANVGWNEIPAQVPTSSTPAWMNRLVKIFRKPNNSQPVVDRIPVKSEIYCMPSTMSYDLQHGDKLASTLGDIARILYSE